MTTLTLPQIIAFARTAAEYSIPLVWYTELELVALFIDIEADGTVHEVQHSYQHVADLMATRTAEDALVLICDEVEEQHCDECKQLCDDTAERFDDGTPWADTRLCDYCYADARADYTDECYKNRDLYGYYGHKRSDFR